MTVATDRLVLRGRAYLRDDGSEELISKSTWALKATGLLFGALLVVGRTASAGNIVWNPTHHSATTPLLVISAAVQKSGQPSRQAPKSPPCSDPAALAKRAAAHEVIAFSPGKDSGDGTEGGAAMSAAPPTGAAGTATGSVASTAAPTGAAGTAPGSTDSSAPTGGAGTAPASTESTAAAPTGAAGTAPGSIDSTAAPTGAAGTAPASTQSTAAAPTGAAGTAPGSIDSTAEPTA